MLEPFESKLTDEKLNELRKELFSMKEGPGGQELTFSHLPGVSIVFARTRNKRRFFMVSIMPMNEEGIATRSKPLFFTKMDVYEGFLRAFLSEDVKKIVEVVEDINSSLRYKKKGDDED